MKILNAGQVYYIKGGAEKYHLVLTELLENHGHEVVPFASKNPKNVSTYWDQYFAEWVNSVDPSLTDKINFIYSTDARKKIKQILAKVDFDLAHLQIYHAQLTGSILKPLLEKNIPIVQTLHDFKLSCAVGSFMRKGKICEDCLGAKYFKAIGKNCNRDSRARTLGSVVESYVSQKCGSHTAIDHFIAVCEFQRQKLIDHGVVKPENISTILNFVDSSIIEPSFEHLNYILYFGRIENIKGIKTLVKATEDSPHIRVKIVGDGKLKEEMENYLLKNNIKHIEFLGYKSGDELAQLISNCAFTVVPSECYELCPLTVLESYAYGKAVIGANIGGIPELIENEVDGLLFESENIQDLRAKIELLFNDKQEIVIMGRKGRKRMEEKFNPEAHYKQLQKVYQKVLQTK
ncbi:MAG: glycosyltransferase family 4 protein [Bacteroidia bacterium]|nr:glycosyltransferase family 4 protein [Bacteroidia bacterium]